MLKSKRVNNAPILMNKMRDHFDNFFMISEDHGYDDVEIAVNLLQIAEERIFEVAESPEQATYIIHDMEKFIKKELPFVVYHDIDYSKDFNNSQEASE
ncbi:hypothetical protein N8230_01135 [Gammaproteobacteria bacterium]|jgi:hypothetical protein|nr:hypothetical protein [Gammaproteobacteria bacterium]